jgi:hypothetical protein
MEQPDIKPEIVPYKTPEIIPIPEEHPTDLPKLPEIPKTDPPTPKPPMELPHQK